MAEQLEAFLQESQQVGLQLGRMVPLRLCALFSRGLAQEDCEKCAYVVPVYEIKSTISNATPQPALINPLNFLNIILEVLMQILPLLFQNIIFMLLFSLKIFQYLSDIG